MLDHKEEPGGTELARAQGKPENWITSSENLEYNRETFCPYWNRVLPKNFSQCLPTQSAKTMAGRSCSSQGASHCVLQEAELLVHMSRACNFGPLILADITIRPSHAVSQVVTYSVSLATVIFWVVTNTF